MSTPNIQVGNRVLFIGGPEAGNVRIIPDSQGTHIKADDDYMYRIWPVAMPGATQKAFFAYAADQHPLQMFIDMWREYSPVAQIKRGQERGLTYQKIGKS